MIPRTLRSFISQLHTATEKDELSWHEADSLAYYCNHKEHSLHISSHFDTDREISSYHFRIVTNGKVTPFSVNDDEEDYPTMRRLYEAVIANANDVASDISDFFD